MCDIWLGTILCLFCFCCIASYVLTFLLSACLELGGCENPVPNSCVKNLLFSCFGLQWPLLGLLGRAGMPFPPKLCQMSGKLQKTGGVPHLEWWLLLSPSLFLGKGYVRGFLSCLDLEVGGSRSTELSELWLLPQERAHLLPCPCACLILLLTEAGPGGFSGVEGFLQPRPAL